MDGGTDSWSRHPAKRTGRIAGRPECGSPRIVARHQRSGRHGFTILEVLTVTGIISTLLALVLPAINSTREAARRTQCVNHLRQIGVALHIYHEQQNCLPPGWQWEATGHSQYGWLVPLLPSLELPEVYNRVDRNVTLDQPANALARQSFLPLLVCPSDLSQPTFLLHEDEELTGSAQALFELPTANYVGVFGTQEPDDTIPAPLGDGAFIEARPIRFAEISRGLAHMLFVGERSMAKVPSTWLGVDVYGEDAACRLTGQVWTSPNCDRCDECEFDSRHPGGANFLFGDGRVQFLSDAIDSQAYRQQARRTE